MGPADAAASSQGTVISGHELAKTYNCRTPGCDGEARATGGRHAYCERCQIRRGTRRPDGAMIQGRIPTAPGSRSARDGEQAQGPFETQALTLVGAGRAIDFWAERYREAKPALEEAIREWRETLKGVAELKFGVPETPAGDDRVPRPYPGGR